MGIWLRGWVWFSCLVMIFVFAPSAHAWPNKLICDFSNGSSWTYDAGQFKSQSSAPLKFEIDSIDLENQAAKLVGSKGKTAGKLRVVRAINANHFIEVATEGYLNLTTIYDVDPKNGVHPAVHSRHLGIVGSPVFGQYTGFCREP